MAFTNHIPTADLFWSKSYSTNKHTNHILSADLYWSKSYSTNKHTNHILTALTTTNQPPLPLPCTVVDNHIVIDFMYQWDEDIFKHVSVCFFSQKALNSRKVANYVKKALKDVTEFNSQLAQQRKEERCSYFDMQTQVQYTQGCATAG